MSQSSRVFLNLTILPGQQKALPAHCFSIQTRLLTLPAAQLTAYAHPPPSHYHPQRKFSFPPSPMQAASSPSTPTGCLGPRKPRARRESDGACRRRGKRTNIPGKVEAATALNYAIVGNHASNTFRTTDRRANGFAFISYHSPPLSMALTATSAPAPRSTPVPCSQPQSPVHEPLCLFLHLIPPLYQIPSPLSTKEYRQSQPRCCPSRRCFQRSKENIPVSAGTSVEASPVTDCVGISAETGEGTGVDTVGGNNGSGLGR